MAGEEEQKLFLGFDFSTQQVCFHLQSFFLKKLILILIIFFRLKSLL